MRALALAVLQLDELADPTAALATVPGVSRYLLRAPGLGGALPAGVKLLTTEDDARAAAAALVRRVSGAEVVVVLRADEEASAELAVALGGLRAESGPARFAAARWHRFLGREIAGETEVVAWCGDDSTAPVRVLAGRVLVVEPDITTAIARLDVTATRRARTRMRVGTGDFVARPAAALVRRLWRRRRGGVPGVVLAALETYGDVVVAAKVWEREERAGRARVTPSARPVPVGFTAMDTRDGFLVVRDDVRESLTRILLRASPEFVDGEPLTRSGRGASWSIALGGGTRAVLRWYRRGGMLRHFMRDRYFGWRPRPLVELEVTDAARGRGIDVPEVLGVRVDRALGGYRGAIVTREIADAETLGTAVERRPQAGERDAIVAAVAHAVRRMHDRGLHHPDLNVGNILLSRSEGTLAAHVIDLDRARLGGSVSTAARERALRRLGRSLAKIEAAGRLELRAERAAFHRVYRGDV
ncbi:MAG TPA: lipopolysaccharide kinase InaA family protein [Candidatus Binatia bacterium]|jgi:3-deoxy-D-manno-octulosonic acid kinase